MDPDSDLDDLAQRFIRLWEESWQQLAQDPEIARHWTKLFEALGQSGPPPFPTAPQGERHDRDAPAEAGPAPAAAAPVDGGERLDELAERVRRLEQRVARLSRRTRDPGGGQSGR